MICLPIEQAMQSHGSFLRHRLQGFGGETGTFLYLPPHTETTLDLEKSPLWQISLGKKARLTLFNAHSTKIDCLLEREAELSFYDRGPNTTMQASVKGMSRLNAFAFSMGGQHAFKMVLLEEEAAVSLSGLSLLRGAQETTSVYVEHKSPNCQSRQHFKGLLDHEGVSDFTGHIYVHPIAQKTRAYQLNQNWLLDPTAKVYTKPNLEIFADDVKASHGATVASMGKEELFYLSSRGILVPDAKQLLVQGFCQELLGLLPHSRWKEAILHSFNTFLT